MHASALARGKEKEGEVEAVSCDRRESAAANWAELLPRWKPGGGGGCSAPQGCEQPTSADPIWSNEEETS